MTEKKFLGYYSDPDILGPNPKIKIQRLSFSTGPEVFKRVFRNLVAQKFKEDIFIETGHFGSKAVP
jgi:hypothetical protein